MGDACVSGAADMAEEMVQALLDGQPLETEEFCDFSLEEQNEATAATGVSPSTPSTFTPELKKNVFYIVAGAIVNDNGEVLMIQEAKSSCAGQWYLPAGRMEPGESIAEAARREVLEETGLEFEPTTLLMVETAGGAWYRFVVTGSITGGRLKTPADADPESLQAQWVADLTSLDLRATDIVPLVELSQAYQRRGETPWHRPLLPAARRHDRLLLRLVVCVRKRANNRVSVLMSEKTSLHLPTCEISPPRSIHSTLKKYMTEMFGADLPPHRPAGVLSVEYAHEPDQPAGLCLTLLVPVRKPLEEAHLIDKYQWCELSRDAGHALLERLGKNRLVTLNVIR
ncbi:8-oxo-dGDP phosphatase NUDT18-like isoform X2 [Pollicipes pollicipes]|uniref:8-oxo-dGDP phosphatase NUDT18-like isoform X2 n=1 Tax=Pollicipes pollicipes TaxID=41117 RepID=UPI0018849BAA|nr:8-oxo-dGDP phosphatase NUDT18-like isoform X2 [Pollicipes pollicipes]